MKDLVVATRNAGKMRELEHLLNGLVERVIPASEAGLPEVDEDGSTFEENALKKARAAVAATGLPSLADDSGLAVDALGGAPGVRSARYAGEGAGDAANNARLLQELSQVPPAERQAAFHCVIALCLPHGECRTFSGTLSGLIIDTPRGEEGFGYDPIFLLPEYGQTLAEISMEEKNRISHRAGALRALRAYLEGNAAVQG